MNSFISFFFRYSLVMSILSIPPATLLELEMSSCRHSTSGKASSMNGPQQWVQYKDL
jgi:hypothetical protein